MTKVSIYMPVYNGSEYLERSIGSVISQTFADWELIALDDESTDDSRAILDGLARRDNRIRVFSKHNDGKGNTARNLAMMEKWAQGEYFFYMSQDDRIDSDLLEKAVGEAEKRSLDIVIPDMLLEYADGTTSAVQGSYPPNGDHSLVFSGKEAFYRGIDFSIHGFALINRRLIDEDRQDTNHYDSDEYNTRLQFLAAGRVGFCDSTFYYYQGNENAITKRFSIRWFQRLDTAVMIDKLFSDTFHDRKSFPKLKSWLMVIYITLSVSYMREWATISPDERKVVIVHFRGFERNIKFGGYRMAVLRRLSPLERCFAVWYFIFGTCRNMKSLFRIYKGK